MISFFTGAGKVNLGVDLDLDPLLDPVARNPTAERKAKSRLDLCLYQSQTGYSSYISEVSTQSRKKEGRSRYLRHRTYSVKDS